MSDDEPRKLDYATPVNQEPSIWRRDIVEYLLPRRLWLRIVVFITMGVATGAMWIWILRLAWVVLREPL